MFSWGGWCFLQEMCSFLEESKLFLHKTYCIEREMVAAGRFSRWRFTPRMVWKNMRRSLRIKNQFFHESTSRVVDLRYLSTKSTLFRLNLVSMTSAKLVPKWTSCERAHAKSTFRPCQMAFKNDDVWVFVFAFFEASKWTSCERAHAKSASRAFKGIECWVLELASFEDSKWTLCERAHAKSTSKAFTMIEI